MRAACLTSMEPRAARMRAIQVRVWRGRLCFGPGPVVHDASFPTKGSIGEWRDGFFVLDNWQVIPKLTVNYGLRYELPTVPYSLNGYTRILNANDTALIPATSATTPADFKPTPGFKFINPDAQ